MIKNLSLKQKILGITTTLILISAIVGAIGFMGLRKVAQSYAKVTDSSLINIVLINNLSRAAADVERSISKSLNPNLDLEGLRKELTTKIEMYKAADKAYQDVPFVPNEENYYNPMADAWRKYEAKVTPFLSLLGSKPSSEVIFKYLDSELFPAQKEFEKKLEELVNFNFTNSKNWTQESHGASDFAINSILFFIAISIIFGFVISFSFSSSVSKALGVVTEGLSSGSEQISQAATQLADSAQTLSASSVEQASSMEETVATMDELTSMVKRNTENVKIACELSEVAQRKAGEGEQEVKKLIASIQDISSNSQKISDITSVIDDIAFQTNLLALNAAVEAARAGEQGKGFAVVADAVRTLAQRSSESAKNIAQLIQNSVAQVKTSSDQAGKSGQVLEEILSAVKRVSDLNNEILSSTQEQENGIVQISQAMSQLDQVTQKNAAVSEESAAASEELSSQAQQLKLNSVALKSMAYGA